MLSRLFPAALLVLLAAAGCENQQQDPTPVESTGELEIYVEHVAGTSPLAVSTPYTTAAGETFRVGQLKYYLSNLKLLRADGSSWAAPDSYYLVDHAQPASQRLHLRGVPAGEYARLMVTIGVDSARNTVGAQTGPLDPVHGMYWDWNSGYVFLRLNGSSPQAPGNGGLFYDVAGFRRPHNTIRTITLPMPASAGALRVRAGATPELHLKANVLKLFEGPHPIRFGQMSSVAGGPDAVKLADNCAAGMFRIDHLHGN